jgi:hypothetical protein
MRFKRPTFLSSHAEQLEDRRVLSANPLDLDLSAIPTQTIFAGDSMSYLGALRSLRKNMFSDFLPPRRQVGEI